MRRLVAGALIAGGIALLPTAAGAGEITGQTVPEPTGALEHARSACAASGLNDLDPTEGQNESKVQTPADAWRYYGLPHGAPGRLGLCRGGA